MIKNPPVNAEDSRDTSLMSESGRSPGLGNGSIPVFLPGKFHGPRSLVDNNPCGHESSTGLSRNTHTHVIKNRNISDWGCWE